ncbi:MAG: SPASM domain-containing protein [Nitrospirae bacterium]|nr:SPASM domain-containing protein [Nitrospirota bacterium]MBF0555070.1 SPASM domain-containing protein [Nitrospirota bacterium]
MNLSGVSVVRAAREKLMFYKEIAGNAKSAIGALITGEIDIDYPGTGVKLSFSNVPLKKLLNMIVTDGSAKTLRPRKVYGLPTMLQIEPSSLCNLKCPACATSRGLKRTAGLMEFGVFKKIVDEIGDYVFVMFFFGTGEPFLHPQAYNMIRYAKEKGIKVISSTNGHSFSNVQAAENLVTSGIDVLTVSMDGIIQSTYEKYRRGGDIEKVKTSVKNIVETKALLKSKTPLVILQLIVMSHNINDMAGYEDFARSLGADAIIFIKFNTVFDESMEAPLNDFLPSDNKLRRFRYDKNDKEEQTSVNGCTPLWNWVSIHSNGNVAPCCFDTQESHVLGNLKESAFKDIWNNEKYLRLRSKVKHNDIYDLLCSKTVCAYKNGRQGVISVKYLDN